MEAALPSAFHTLFFFKKVFIFINLISIYFLFKSLRKNS